jgi:putative flippase GtrA
MLRQPLRYVLAGGATALTYFAVTLLLAGPAGLPIQAAIPLGYVTGLVMHFTLQRYFVFRSHAGFALALHHQLGRYLLLALAQYAFTAAATAILPDVLGVDERIVYVCAALCATVTVFLTLRAKVFVPAGS